MHAGTSLAVVFPLNNAPSLSFCLPYLCSLSKKGVMVEITLLFQARVRTITLHACYMLNPCPWW